jgi:hypothetical protein
MQCVVQGVLRALCGMYILVAHPAVVMYGQCRVCHSAICCMYAGGTPSCIHVWSVSGVP